MSVSLEEKLAPQRSNPGKAACTPLQLSQMWFAPDFDQKNPPAVVSYETPDGQVTWRLEAGRYALQEQVDVLEDRACPSSGRLLDSRPVKVKK
jgi:hypothetical protein